MSWPLIIALSACGGGGGGSATLQVTTDMRGDRNENDIGPGGESLTGETKQTPRVITKLKGGVVGGSRTGDEDDVSEPNLGPRVHNKPPSFLRGDGDAENGPLVVGREFSYTLPKDTFVDPEGQPITYSLSSEPESVLPDGLTFDAATGRFSGTPTRFPETPDTKGEPFRSTVKIIGADPEGQTHSVSISFEVYYPNRAPTIAKQMPDLSFGEGVLITLNLREFFDDPDRDILTFTVTGAPDGVGTPAFSRWFSGRAKETGTFEITVTAKDYHRLSTDPDAGLTVSQSFTLTIVGVQTLTGDGEIGADRLQGNANHREIFDLRPDGDEMIVNFDPRYDRILVGTSEIYAKKINVPKIDIDGQPDPYHTKLYADQAATQLIGTVGTVARIQDLTGTHFDAHALDDSLEDVTVSVTYLSEII